jgi:hypothetical protein
VADAIQAWGEHFCVHAQADIEVIWHFEEAARKRWGVKLRPQALEEKR